MDNSEALALCQLNTTVLKLHDPIRSLDPTLDRAESLVLASNAVDVLMDLIKQNKAVENDLRDAIARLKQARNSKHNN